MLYACVYVCMYEGRLISNAHSMWRTSIYNLCILLVEVGSSGNKNGGKNNTCLCQRGIFQTTHQLSHIWCRKLGYHWTSLHTLVVRGRRQLTRFRITVLLRVSSTHLQLPVQEYTTVCVASAVISDKYTYCPFTREK